MEDRIVYRNLASTIGAICIVALCLIALSAVLGS